MSHLLLIGLIIAGAGILGGFANYHRFESNQEFNWFNFRRSLLLGLVASAAVPLFLQMLSSTIISDAGEDGKAWLYFVFAGFCLVAAFFSTRFLQTLGDRVIKELEEVKQKTQKLEEETEENAAKVDVLVDNNTDHDLEEDLATRDHGLVSKGIKNEGQRKELSDMEKVIQTFRNKNYSFRTLESIAKECDLDIAKVEQLILKMKEEKLIRKFSTKRGKPIYAINKQSN